MLGMYFWYYPQLRYFRNLSPSLSAVCVDQGVLLSKKGSLQCCVLENGSTWLKSLPCTTWRKRRGRYRLQTPFGYSAYAPLLWGHVDAHKTSGPTLRGSALRGTYRQFFFGYGFLGGLNYEGLAHGGRGFPFLATNDVTWTFMTWSPDQQEDGCWTVN